METKTLLPLTTEERRELVDLLDREIQRLRRCFPETGKGSSSGADLYRLGVLQELLSRLTTPSLNS
jgi:hypothetical protein